MSGGSAGGNSLVHWWTRNAMDADGSARWISCRPSAGTWGDRRVASKLRHRTDDVATCLTCVVEYLKYCEDNSNNEWVKSRE